jgi:hypothetical protein
MDANSKYNFLSDLLRLPARALIKSHGGRGRPKRTLHSRLRAILRNQLEQDDLVTSSPNTDHQKRDPDALRVERAKALVSCGYISRAARALVQGELVNPSAEVMDTLRSLHPNKASRVPSLPPTAPHVVTDLEALSDIISSKLRNGSAPGPSGWTGELVAPLISDADCLMALGTLVGDIVNGNLDTHSRSLLMASLLIPAPKGGGGIRPIAISECFYKLATMYATSLIRDTLPSIFEPIQLGVGAVGGTERAVHILQAGLETLGPDTVVLKCDLKNAFNECKRDFILNALFRHEQLRPLWRIAHWAYGQPSSLLVVDHGTFVDQILSIQGVKQGDCMGSLLFSLAVHPLYQECIRGLDDVRAAAIADDFNLVGPREAVFTAFDRFARSLEPSGLTLCRPKCGVLCPHFSPPLTLQDSARTRAIPVHIGTMETLGVLLGSSDPVMNTWLEGQVESHQPFFQMLLRTDMPIQVAFVLLRMSAIPRLGYLTRVLPPRLMTIHAAKFDSLVLGTVVRKLGLPDPIPNEAKLTLSLPIRLGGFGLRSVASTCHVAYYSSIALTAVDIANLVPHSKRSQLLLNNSTQVDFARQLVDCHNHLIKQKVPCDEDGLMPPTVDHFWTDFGEERPHGLQRAISHHIISQNLNTYLRDPSTELKTLQRMLSASSRNAGAWLTCYPSCPELSLSDEDFIYASRLRLGLSCQENLPPVCACSAKLADDPAHFLSCAKLKATAMTTRHDWIVHLLAKFLRGAGAVVHIEPRIFGEERKRPDLDILFPDKQMTVDVTVVHPAAPSKSSRTRLAAASAAEKAKHRYYDTLANLHGTSLRAFAVETYGGFGKEASEVMTLLQQSLDSRQGGNRLPAQALAVALQRGNVLVLKTGALAARRLQEEN